MAYFYYMPTKIIIGDECVKENCKELKLGKRALVISYDGAQVCGALDDVRSALDSQQISYKIYSQIQTNPSVTQIDEMRRQIYGCCDFVIGVGGGSSLDTAKAAAVLAVNDICADELYKNDFINTPLPLVMVPTTAGTGAEVTFNSVLTLADHRYKKSFGTVELCAKMAFLDAKYIEKMPLQIARDTALDALSHAIEGYLSANATPIGSMFAEECFRNFAYCRPALVAGAFTKRHREKLMLSATYGGIIIAQERTLAPHAMGYALTCLKNIAHGPACMVLTAAYLECMESKAKQRVAKMLGLLEMNSIRELGECINQLICISQNFTEQDIIEFTELSASAAIAKPNLCKMDEAMVSYIYKKSLLNH